MYDASYLSYPFFYHVPPAFFYLRSFFPHLSDYFGDFRPLYMGVLYLLDLFIDYACAFVCPYYVFRYSFLVGPVVLFYVL